jgi:hypothetical protein
MTMRVKIPRSFMLSFILIIQIDSSKRHSVIFSLLQISDYKLLKDTIKNQDFL